MHASVSDEHDFQDLTASPSLFWCVIQQQSFYFENTIISLNIDDIDIFYKVEFHIIGVHAAWVSDLHLISYLDKLCEFYFIFFEILDFFNVGHSRIKFINL